MLTESFNKQNDIIERMLGRHDMHQNSLQEFDEATMALGMAYDGVIKLHFCNNGGKIAPKLYLIDVLEQFVKPFNKTLFANKP